MDLDFLSDDDLLEDVGAFEAASGPGDAWNSVPLPVSLDLDAAASILMSDSAFIETVQMKQGCMKDIEAPPRARNTAPKQRAKLVDSREKNRLKQAAYRNKMKVIELEFSTCRYCAFVCSHQSGFMVYCDQPAVAA